MSDTHHETHSKPQAPARLTVPELPQRILDTYSRLWQLETWLRRLVYIELRAHLGDDWESKVSGAEKPKQGDKRLTHMPSPEDNALSYAQFSALCRIVAENWRLFDPFLPPESIWKGKLEEVSQIRHRVAHFRSGHSDDLQRVNQLLRDTDRGFWLFCTSYNDPKPVLPQSDDPVEEHFLHLDPFPWSPAGERAWARYGVADPEAHLAVTVEVLCRPWTNWTTPVAGKEGFLYDVNIRARKNLSFDCKRLLQSTSRLHKHFVHISLDNWFQSLRLTLPAVLGSERIIEIIEKVIDVSNYCLSYSVHGQAAEDAAQALADAWPEYVLGPENPLTFLTPDMECSFFGV